jgi:ParB family chromosome partitioning protein
VKARRGLGRGLDSLITSSLPGRDAMAEEGSSGQILRLAVADIVPSPWQPRREFDSGALEELAFSIRDSGLISPLVVRPLKDGRHELIAGERRLRAVRDILKWADVPARLMTADDAKARELTLVENLQRADLNPIEEAAAYSELQSSLGLTHEAIAERLHVSRAKITNALRLFRLPEEIKKLVADGSLDMGKARAVAGIDNPLDQIRLARRAVADGLSTRQVEQAVGERKTGVRRPEKRREAYIESIEERLRLHFGSKVTVADHGGAGRIIINYFSPAEAERIFTLIGLPPEE